MTSLAFPVKLSGQNRKMNNALVLGIGNILCGDDGAGCRAAEYLYVTRRFPDSVKIMDGGTLGQDLLGPISDADNVLLIDCVDFGAKPGEIIERDAGAIPIWLGAIKLSPHQGGLAEALALASLKGVLPDRLKLLGVQGFDLTFGNGLSKGMIRIIPDICHRAEEILANWGYKARQATTGAVFLSDAPVAMQFCEPLIPGLEKLMSAS